jgi:DNA-binding transcriptional MocR family regulator
VGSWTVIDETFVELSLDEDPPPPAAVGGSNRVITIGSLSKAVWAGLRVGWARADQAVVRRLALTRATCDTASPVFEQLVAARTLERLDDIMRERRKIIDLRRQTLAAALDQHLPTWSYRQPLGGLFIWAELPEMIATSLAVEARQQGLHITPGPVFGRGGIFERYVRLPFTLPPDQLTRAVEILATLPVAAGPAAGDELPFVA